MRLNIKALSVNRAFKGRRFRTKEYDAYEKAVRLLLPKMDGRITEKMKLSLVLHFGFSSSNSDADNGVKLIQDILSKHYGFNDKQIFHLLVTKEIVKKGSEFIEFSLREA